MADEINYANKNKVEISSELMTNIADKIRSATGSTNKFTVDEMVEIIPTLDSDNLDRSAHIYYSGLMPEVYHLGYGRETQSVSRMYASAINSQSNLKTLYIHTNISMISDKSSFGCDCPNLTNVIFDITNTDSINTLFDNVKYLFVNTNILNGSIKCTTQAVYDKLMSLSTLSHLRDKIILEVSQ